MFYVYILRTINNRLYIGQTIDLKNRIKLHKKHLGAKVTKDNHDCSLVYTEGYKTLLEAIQREKQLKGWTRAKKEGISCRR